MKKNNIIEDRKRAAEDFIRRRVMGVHELIGSRLFSNSTPMSSMELKNMIGDLTEALRVSGKIDLLNEMVELGVDFVEAK